MAVKTENLVKALIFDVIIRGAIVRLVASVPFLALPVINQIVVFIVMRVAGIIYTELDYHVALTLINIRGKLQTKRYTKAVAQLKAVIKNEMATPEELENAKEEFKTTLRSFVKYK